MGSNAPEGIGGGGDTLLAGVDDLGSFGGGGGSGGVWSIVEAAERKSARELSC
jgi:hypothetical protein